MGELVIGCTNGESRFLPFFKFLPNSGAGTQLEPVLWASLSFHGLKWAAH